MKNNVYKKSSFRNSKRGIILLSAVCSGLFASAQDDDVQIDDDEVYLMSPFVVEGDQDVGYLATSTVAGTRIKSNLSDLAASIFVVTPEFMKDTGSNDIEDLLVYTGGTEVSGAGGNFLGLSGAPDGQNGPGTGTSQYLSPGSKNRIRGLASATVTRNYFETRIPFDSYNMDRVLINRGPNSVLFGLGSPAGVINYSLDKAYFMDKGDLSFEYDNWGSKRASLSYNKVIVDDIFSVQVDLLANKQRYEQKQAYKRDNRAYAAAIYRPTKTTTVRASYEKGEIDAVSPVVTPPVDFITQWFLDGKPTVNPLTFDRSQYLEGDNRYAVFAWWQPTLMYDDVNGSDCYAMTYRAYQTNPETGETVLTNMAFSTDDNFAFANTGGTTGLAPSYLAPFWSSVSLTDTSVFDYRNNIITGSQNGQEMNFEVYNVSIEQTALNGDLGFELAYNNEKTDSLTHQNAACRLSVDVNEYLLDGSPNPNVGRPVVSSTGNCYYNEIDREDLRFTAYYNINFADKLDNKIGWFLGNATVTGVATEHETTTFGTQAWDIVAGDDFAAAVGMGYNRQDGNIRRVWISRYLGPSLLDAGTTASNSNIPGIQVYQEIPDSASFTYWENWQGVNEWGDAETGTYSIINSLDYDKLAETATYAYKRKTNLTSYVLVAQNQWMNNLFTTTAGWRSDRQKSYDAGLPSLKSNGVYDIYDEEWILPNEANSLFESETVSYGTVFHIPDLLKSKSEWMPTLSLHYNNAENFEPTGNRYDMYGNIFESPEGSTEDYGFTLGFLEDKINIRVNFYKASQSNISQGSLPIGQVFSQAARLLETFPELESQLPLPSQALLDHWNWNVQRGSNGLITDVQYTTPGNTTDITNVTSEGTEIEIVCNPTSQWRIAFNVTKQEAVRDNTAPAFSDFVESFIIPNWLEGTAGSLLANETGETLAESTMRLIVTPYKTIKLQDGGPALELRKWRWNMITNYTFDNLSILNGWNIGGGVRWQDGVAIGFPVIYDDSAESYVSDVSNPYYSDPELRIDAFVGYSRTLFDGRIDWDISLHIRNLLNDDELIPLSSNPDGSVAYYRISEPLTWKLTSTFSF